MIAMMDETPDPRASRPPLHLPPNPALIGDDTFLAILPAVVRLLADEVTIADLGAAKEAFGAVWIDAFMRYGPFALWPPDIKAIHDDVARLVEEAEMVLGVHYSQMPVRG